MEAKFGPIEKKGQKRSTSIEMKLFQKNSRVHPLLATKRDEEILELLKVEPDDEKLRRHKSNWLRHVKKAKNEQQQDAKNNAEL